jgi:hypothetical protein
MKIDIAIHSSDSSSLYLDFWPIVSEIWFTKFNITPVLIYIDNDINKLIDETYGIVIRLIPIENEPISLQNQIARFWYTSKMPDSISIISDIDMLPISRKYFCDTIQDFKNDMYLHINPCIDTYGRLPACYHISLGKVFKEVLEIDDKWEDFYYKVKESGFKICEKNNLPNWFCDESYTTDKVLNYHDQNKIKFIQRENGQNGYRIDRANFKYFKYLLSLEYYYDMHSVRPYLDFKNEIDFIKNKILLSKNRKPLRIELLTLSIWSRIINKIKNL